MRSDTGEVPDLWLFLSVDGGATDNEPIQLARTALAGLLKRNPRDREEAKRAVWLIDPFAGKADLGPADDTAFPEELGAVVTTLTEQTRYDTSDLLMAGDTNIFSRFMLTPTRNDDQGTLLTGGEAIASAGRGGPQQEGARVRRFEAPVAGEFAKSHSKTLSICATFSSSATSPRLSHLVGVSDREAVQFWPSGHSTPNSALSSDTQRFGMRLPGLLPEDSSPVTDRQNVKSDRSRT